LSTPTTHISTSLAAGLEDPAVKASIRRRRTIGLALGIAGAILVYLIMPADSATLASNAAEAAGKLPEEGFALHPLKMTAAMAVLMGIWWMTEAIPLAATALIPVALFNLFDIVPFKTAATQYASGTIFLFMGGFMLALAMQRWNLHRRIALVIVKAVGTTPKRLVGGFMLATGFITMWVSNTATAVMMLPLGLSILQLVGQLSEKSGAKSKFGTSLMLGIAYAASIGSLSTLIGTPPNALLKENLASTFDIQINFGTWMLAGVPLALVYLVFCWWLLTHVLFKAEIDEIPGGKEMINRELKAMGPMNNGEKLVGIIFVLAALSWAFIPTMFSSLGIKDEDIAMIVAVVLFLTPAYPKKGTQVLDWKTAKDLPWDVLLLFGGGLALSSTFEATGLSYWIGEVTKGLGSLPTVFIIAGVTALVIFLTEMTSNTATAAVFLPIMAGVSQGLGMDPLMLMVPVAIAATCAFMLPVATPPNAIAFGSGYVTIGEMVRGGVWLNVGGIVLITASMYALFIPILGIAH
jgi:sodium-dependent dicarboxylate transporter 2/3/5